MIFLLLISKEIATSGNFDFVSNYFVHKQMHVIIDQLIC